MTELMNQAAAAAYLGVSPATLRGWERKGYVKRENLPGAYYTAEGLKPSKARVEAARRGEDWDNVTGEQDES